MSEARPLGRREVHARAPCRRVEEGDIAVAALRRVRGRACRRGGEARVADDAICRKPARTGGRLLRPTRIDLAATTRAGAPADARRPAFQPEAREAPAVAVQRRRETAPQSTRVAAVGGEGVGLQAPRNERSASTRASRGPRPRAVPPGRGGRYSRGRPPTCAGPCVPERGRGPRR